MNAVLISRMTAQDSALMSFAPQCYSLARVVCLGQKGPMLTRESLKELIGCEYLSCDSAMWDGLMVSIFSHDDDWLDDEGEREIACEITDYSCYNVIGLLEGPLVITGAVTAEGIYGLGAEAAQELADRINSGIPLKGMGDLRFTFTDLLDLETAH